MKRLLFLLALLPSLCWAQVGEHRNIFSIGVNGGYILSNVGFVPKVLQGNHGGLTGGLTFRYVCEKYFKSICSVQAEVNYAKIGWSDDIKDADDVPLLIEDGSRKKYARTVDYIQIPVFAHLAWGKENRGGQFFFQVGPQIGIYLKENTTTNFTPEKTADGRSGAWMQETMPVENKFDYGIAAGMGGEHTIGNALRAVVEARYYYGLGNIFGDSKRDYFGKSNFGNIVVKCALLLDLGN